MPLKAVIDNALREWDAVPKGHPVCVLEPRRFCIRPSGHADKHSWVPLPDKQ